MRITIFALFLCCITLTASAQIKSISKKVNVGKAVQAATEVTQAIKLSDEDIAKLSKEYMVWMDKNNPVASPESEYAQRLQNLIGDITEVDGMEVNFAVYEVVDVNAFACGDGSIRVFAGLMDVMSDDEIMAIIGHEIGHVVNTDTKDAMKSAYLRSAAKNAAGAVSDKLSKLGDSQLGILAEALAGAQYSQKQENEADDYAFQFCIKNSVDPYAMSNALYKLVEMYESGGEKASAISQMFSTHPDSEKRAKRMKEKADQYTNQ